jgi:hypothetical protein
MAVDYTPRSICLLGAPIALNQTLFRPIAAMGSQVQVLTVLNPRGNTEFLKPKYALTPSNTIDTML